MRFLFDQLYILYRGLDGMIRKKNENWVELLILSLLMASPDKEKKNDRGFPFYCIWWLLSLLFHRFFPYLELINLARNRIIFHLRWVSFFILQFNLMSLSTCFFTFFKSILTKDMTNIRMKSSQKKLLHMLF